AKLSAPRRMPELPQRFRFNLPDALARDGEALADFFQRVFAAVAHAEAHLDDFLLARRERLEHRLGLLLEIQVDDRFGRRDHLPIFGTLRTFDTGMSIRFAISSEVGSRPSSCTSARDVRISLLMVSIMWTGIRIVRAWSAIARVIAWRIHHVAYVENL